MSLPAADLPVPLAVLVLAWDEDTPAVRALLEATQASAPTVGSVLVMVPQAETPDHFSAEGYLPLDWPAAEAPTAEDEATLSEEPLADRPPPAPASLLPTPVRAAPARAVEAPAAEVPALAPLLPGTTPAALSNVATQPAFPAAPLKWAAVRVLHLGGQSLPQLARRAGQPLPAPIWTGTATPPAAPYLGADPTAPVPLAAPAPVRQLPTQIVLSSPTLRSTSEIAPASTSPVAPYTRPVPTPPPPAAPLYEVAEPPTQAPDLEADLLPTAPDELAEPEVFNSSLGGSKVADELPTPAQADWPAALASLRQPATPPSNLPLPEPAPAALPAPATAATAWAPPAALQPAATHYPAPDLNFQIIQYARFAVPVALAEAPFAAIYAPAWPTWLAAQELRQRTGRPLVLHLAELAAPAGESAETAAGWMAELQRQALHRADLVLAETPALAQRLHRELGLSQAHVQVVAAADVATVAQALHEARPRPAALA